MNAIGKDVLRGITKRETARSLYHYTVEQHFK